MIVLEPKGSNLFPSDEEIQRQEARDLLHSYLSGSGVSVETKEYAIDKGSYSNRFVVHFNGDGKAILVEIFAKKNVSPEEAALKSLKIALWAANQRQDYREIARIAMELQELEKDLKKKTN